MQCRTAYGILVYWYLLLYQGEFLAMKSSKCPENETSPPEQKHDQFFVIIGYPRFFSIIFAPFFYTPAEIMKNNSLSDCV